MIETFKASNGWHIDMAGKVCGPSGGVVITGGESEHVAEFFQELRDHELGRWRDPVNPDYVVYPDKENHFIDQPAVRVVNEKTGAMGCASLAGASSSTGLAAEDHGIRDAARRYFEAHPERKPLPTTPGLYGYRSAFDTRGCSYVLELTVSGGWVRANGDVDERVTAQEWHDAGELVRLVPEGGDDE